MTVKRLEHIGIVVDDLEAATAFFAALGLELEGEASVEGGLVDRINGLEGVRADIVMLRTLDGNAKVELAKYRSPSYGGDNGLAPANALGIRHILFVVDDIEESLANLRAHGGELVGELVNYENQLLAVLRTRPDRDHRRAGGEDQLTGVPLFGQEHVDRDRETDGETAAGAYLLAWIVAGLAAAGARLHPRPRWAPHSH